MAWRRLLHIGLLSLLLMACGTSAPVSAISPTPPATPTAPAVPVSATPRSARSVPPPTIAVAVVPALPPIIVTNPLPAATPWSTNTPDAVATTVAIDVEATGVAWSATATVAALNTPNAVPTCVATWPTPTVESTGAAIEHFENGLMFWLQTRNDIWVLIDSPTPNQYYWRTLPNQWSDGIAESDPDLNPPPDRYQPVRGFGYAWRIGSGSMDAQRSDLGWALDEETGFATSLIYYPQGYFSPDCTWLPKSGIYEMQDNQGNVYRFVGEGGVANVVGQ